MSTSFSFFPFSVDWGWNRQASFLWRCSRATHVPKCQPCESIYRSQSHRRPPQEEKKMISFAIICNVQSHMRWDNISEGGKRFSRERLMRGNFHFAKREKLMRWYGLSSCLTTRPSHWFDPSRLPEDQINFRRLWEALESFRKLRKVEKAVQLSFAT